jgi:zinc protease
MNYTRIASGACAALLVVPGVLSARTTAPQTSLPPATPTAIVASAPAIVRATLANGMRVVLVPNHLAPVATAVMTYGVGSDDDPTPGTAHATEHMMFRGTGDVSAGQFSDLAARAGAQYDAQTTNISTLFYFKLPSTYVGLALHLEADRMNGAAISPKAWKTERGAIEQEVRADQSVPGFPIGVQIRHAFFGNSPYADDALGTIDSFNKMTAADIATFYKTWYHPNDATLVVAGDIDPVATLAQIHQLFDPIPAVPLPAHKTGTIAPLTSSTIAQGIAELPVPVAGLAFRSPSLTDPDFAAGEVLVAVLNDARGPLVDLVSSGSMLGAQALSSAFPDVGVAELVAIGRPGTQPAQGIATLQGVLQTYRTSGVPSDLIAAAKARLLSLGAYRQASISGTAFAWANALAVGQMSPDDDTAELAAVTDADVNRVLHTYYDPARCISIALLPKASASIAKVDPNAGVENVAYTSDKDQLMPSWAAPYFAAPLRAPNDANVSIVRLPNGVRLTVRRETLSPTVVIDGSIKVSPDLDQPIGKDGVADLTNDLMPWGTTTLDRPAYAAAIDRIQANVALGSSFSMTAQSKDFDAAMSLLADGMLHPAFPQKQFDVFKADVAQSLGAIANLPSTKAAIAQADGLYPPGDPRRRRATPSSVSSVTLADVKHWYAYAYRPDLTSIAIVGDVTPQQARDAVTKYFSGWKSTLAMPNFHYPTLKTAKSKSITVTSSVSQQSQVTLTQVLRLHRRDRDAIALDLANTILSGQGTGSLLFRDVRTAKGYVYTIDSSMDVGASSSTFSIDFSSDPKNVSAAQAAAVSVVRRLQSAPLPLVEVQQAKALLLAQRVLPLDSYAGVASDLLADAKYDYTTTDANFYWKNLLEITPLQLQQAMRKYIDTKHFLRVIVAPGS